jgi:hypothetical protein
MFRYVNSIIYYKFLIPGVILLSALHLMRVQYWHTYPRPNSAIMFFLLLILGMFSNKKIPHDVLWALPLKRIQIWCAFLLRLLIITAIFIISEIIQIIICKHPLYDTSTFNLYLIYLIIAIIVYNIRTMMYNFERKSTRFVRFHPIIINLLVPFLSIICIIALMNYHFRTLISETFWWTLAFINIIFPIIASYFITMRSKSLINFKIG